MEFRKMVMITLYARQQKRHICIEQSFGLCGRGQGWDDLGEWHWNMYIIICEMNSPVQVWCMRQGAQGWCPGMTLRDGMVREVGGGFRMGDTCTPMADSSQCMAKPIQCCKINNLKKKTPLVSSRYTPSSGTHWTFPHSSCLSCLLLWSHSKDEIFCVCL